MNNFKPESKPTFWINHASRLIMREFEQRLRPLDFGMAYMPGVMALRESGELTQKELAERAHVEQPTMAALLARMQRDGLILRKPHPQDKRSSRVSLSAKAKASLPDAITQLLESADRATSGLSQREQATLIELLRRVVMNLGNLDA